VIRRNVLIFHAGGLGDFVLSWPLGLALGRLHPQSRIIYVTHASKGELAAAAVRLDWRDIETSWPSLYSDPASLAGDSRKLLEQAHSIYTFMATPDDAWCRNVSTISPEAMIVPLRTKPPDDYIRHASDYLLQQLAAMPVIQTSVTQLLASIEAAGLPLVRRKSEKTILVHPGSGARGKCFPISLFAGIVDQLGQNGRKVKIVLGEAELERFTSEQMRQLEDSAPIMKPPKYVDLLAQIAQAHAFIGHDTGPTHLAGMIGVPTLALFGPTNPAVWRPIGPRVAVFHRTDMANVQANDIGQALEELAPPA
jgi:heptosyltransferase-3